jgi:hypothetical protein
LESSRHALAEARNQADDEAVSDTAADAKMIWTQAPPAKDLQVAELVKLTQDRIAAVYRVPLAILGLERASSGTTEQLMGFWLASGLGFCLDHIEQASDSNVRSPRMAG